MNVLDQLLFNPHLLAQIENELHKCGYRIDLRRLALAVGLPILSRDAADENVPIKTKPQPIEVTETNIEHLIASLHAELIKFGFSGLVARFNSFVELYVDIKAEKED